ncbi:MAG: ferredoxin [Sphingomonadaceae bacterium]
MYVCICNAIKESCLREAAVKCHGSAEEVYLSLGRVPQCRQCLDEAEGVLMDARAAANVPAILAN